MLSPIYGRRKLMNDCPYCLKDASLDAFGYFAVELKTSNVYIFKEQSHPGRLIVAHKKHVSEICELSEEERKDFFEDVNRVAVAMHKAFKPDKINYGAYGDTGHHLHFHLVPKYKDEYEWGGVFLMNPKRRMVDNETLENIAKKLRECLEK